MHTVSMWKKRREGVFPAWTISSLSIVVDLFYTTPFFPLSLSLSNVILIMDMKEYLFTRGFISEVCSGMGKKRIFGRVSYQNTESIHVMPCNVPFT